MGRNVDIIEDIDGNKIVIINDIIFKGKRRIKWNEVEEYLKDYVGTYYEITESAEKIYIGSDFPDEFSNSRDSIRLKGTLAKAKANSAQGVPEMIEIATNKRSQKNLKEKHNKRARYGWYRYISHFALPIYDQEGSLIRYNVFSIEMLIRHADDGKKYLYDLVNIKKETSTPHK